MQHYNNYYLYTIGVPNTLIKNTLFSLSTNFLSLFPLLVIVACCREKLQWNFICVLFQIPFGKLEENIQTSSKWRFGHQKLDTLQSSFIGEILLELCNGNRSFMENQDGD